MTSKHENSTKKYLQMLYAMPLLVSSAVGLSLVGAQTVFAASAPAVPAATQQAEKSSETQTPANEKAEAKEQQTEATIEQKKETQAQPHKRAKSKLVGFGFFFLVILLVVFGRMFVNNQRLVKESEGK